MRTIASITLHGLAAGVVCGAALLLAPRSARADDFKDHVDRAEALAREDRYREALAELDAAYALRQAPHVLYLKAVAQQRLGDAPGAVASYQAFLAADTGADPALRAAAQQRVDELRRLTSPTSRRLPVLTPITFAARDEDNLYAISTDGGSCATPCRLDLTPGAHKISVKGEGTFDFELKVPRIPGMVRVQHPYSSLLVSGIVLMTAGSVMMIGGNLGLFRAFDGDGDPSGSFGAVIAFGWVLGPVAHLVGIGLMAGGLAKLSGSNAFQPVGFDLAPTAHGGGTGRVTFAF